MSGPIHLVLASDENFAQHLAVTVTSVLYNTAASVVIHVLHDGLSAKTIEKLESCTAGKEARFDFVRLSMEEFADLPSRPNISLMTYARMKIPALLPQLPRALYLDCDVVVCADIQPLWETDLEGNAVAAALDYASPRKVERLGISPGHYFNAGMLLMDLGALRAMHFNDLIVNAFTDPERKFAHDQDLLNLLFKNNWKRVHSRWNLVIHHDEVRSRRLKIHEFDEFREALADPGIIHYTGIKPSSYLHDSPFKDRYWFYLAMTPWRDYRYPPPTFRQIGRKWRKRIKQRLRRAAARLSFW